MSINWRDYGSVTRRGDTGAVTDSIFADDDDYIGDGNDGESDPALNNDDPDGYQPDEGRDLSDVVDSVAGEDGDRLDTDYGQNIPSRDGVQPTESIADRPASDYDDPALAETGSPAAPSLSIPSWVYGAGGAAVAAVLAIAIGGSDDER